MNRRVGPHVTPSTRPILGQDAESRLLRRPNDGRARLGRREVGLEEEVEERRRAPEVHEEERRQGREAYLTGGAKLRYKRLTGQI